ncbi:hypothetical protein N658DRAFT_507867 [Parathielavia hyrcaniae]|uniref:Cyanovirin-N domain-containing protein n=1 Tax=Parathielavia hyrcaniae TaxID=113614 RepID=A0AAN6PYW5_9PEZI|nr:hypothetical protein N658DRAFT_507867 [Parathielavia hyrcaniae]
MQFLALLAIAAVTAAAALPDHPATSGDASSLGGGFVPNCYFHEVGKRGVNVGRLTGKCSDDTTFSELYGTWLDLNLCLGNNNGTLIWQDKGNAIATSCKDCKSRHFDPQWIECSYRGRSGAWKQTSLDLNQGVRYEPGPNVLACFGHLGVSTD